MSDARHRVPAVLMLLAVLLPAATARADALADLHAFMDDARSGRAEFSQQVTPRDGHAQPQVTGTVAFQRPGKFRWDVQKPYRQLIVADGQKVWLWDPDLNQLTVKAQAKALGATPAALLAGENRHLEQDFALSDRGTSEGLAWVEAVPKGGDTGFSSIRLGFSGKDLARMDLLDSFGQLTRIRFSRFEHGLSHPEGLFQFSRPAGADQIDESP